MCLYSTLLVIFNGKFAGTYISIYTYMYACIHVCCFVRSYIALTHGKYFWQQWAKFPPAEGLHFSAFNLLTETCFATRTKAFFSFKVAGLTFYEMFMLSQSFHETTTLEKVILTCKHIEQRTVRYIMTSAFEARLQSQRIFFLL